MKFHATVVFEFSQVRGLNDAVPATSAEVVRSVVRAFPLKPFR